MDKPEVFLLCGAAGSGKTTFADELVAQGIEKFSIDESMAEHHGRAGVDYSVEQYPEFERELLAQNKERVAGILAVGRSVVLDYGFARRAERDDYKEFVERNGGRWRLMYFKAPVEVLWQRIQARNERNDANALPISRALLQDLVSWFEVPSGEGEEAIEVK